MEDTAILTLPPALARAIGVERVTAYYTALVDGAILHGVFDGERRIDVTREQHAEIETLLGAAAAPGYIAARHATGAPRDAARGISMSRPKPVRYRSGRWG